MHNAFDPSNFDLVFKEQFFTNLHLKLETNRKLGSKFKSEFFKKLKELDKTNFGKLAKNLLDKHITPSLNRKYLYERMLDRAIKFAEKKQFMKAYTLAYEAILTAFINKYNQIPNVQKLNIDTIQDRNQASSLIVKALGNIDPNLAEEYKKLKNIRNAIVHGSNPIGVSPANLEDPDYLLNVVLKAKNIIENILSLNTGKFSEN